MANFLKYKDKKFSVGDTIQVYATVKEGGKDRTQMFEGTLIGVKGREENKSFTVRKIASGAIGVERIWPIKSPTLVNVISKRRGKARRAKLYYLRDLVGKQATKIKEVEVNEKETSRKPRRKTRKKAASK